MDIARGIGKVLEEMEKVHAEVAAVDARLDEMSAALTEPSEQETPAAVTELSEKAMPAMKLAAPRGK